MRLFEAILEANRRMTGGSTSAAVSLAEHGAALPVAALTCIDTRLNHLLPEMLGISEEHFIWLRNAGNIITGPLSSTMRSLALACAVKGAKEIAVIGHTDCVVGRTTMLQLLEKLGTLGVDRNRLPENLVEYFGLFASERQNVIRGVDLIRSSPLIGTKVPVHGLLIDVQTGRLESVVNGYEYTGPVVPGKAGEILNKAERSLETLARIGHFADEELRLPNVKIGEVVSVAQDWLGKAEQVAAAVLPATERQKPASSHASTRPVIPPNPLTTLQERMRQFAKARGTVRPPRKH